MSAQICDQYIYNKEEYSIVALSAPLDFSPEQYGLKADASGSMCWRGYWCTYNIGNDGIVLKDLYLYNDDSDYPPFNGVEVSPPEFYESEGHTQVGKRRKLIPKHFGHRVYRDVDLHFRYTGKILVGDGFISEYYIHMGFQRAWAYKRLIEFEFIDGELVGCHDYSQQAADMRQAITESGIDPGYPMDVDIPQFVEDSFLLDYETKASWLI